MTTTETALDWKQLLRRAIEARRQPPKRSGGRYLWSVVGQMLCTGSGESQRVCRELGFDPDELVKGA